MMYGVCVSVCVRERGGIDQGCCSTVVALPTTRRRYLPPFSPVRYSPSSPAGDLHRHHALQGRGTGQRQDQEQRSYPAMPVARAPPSESDPGEDRILDLLTTVVPARSVQGIKGSS